METSPYATELLLLRMRAGLTQQDLANALGYEQASISGYERAEIRPSAKRYQRLVTYLDAVISGDDSRAQAIAERAA